MPSGGPTGVSHISIQVRNLERSLGFGVGADVAFEFRRLLLRKNPHRIARRPYQPEASDAACPRVVIQARPALEHDPAVDPGALAPGAAKVTGAVSVTIGGVTLAPEDVQYIGLVPTAISALYQVNVRIPAATPDGDIPVVLSIGAAQTQSGATIPVKSGT